MKKNLLTRADLSARWQVDSRTITNWENEGIIQRVKGIPVPRYSLEHIETVEGLENKNSLSPLERKNLEKELNNLKSENQKLKTVLANILSESAKVVEINMT